MQDPTHDHLRGLNWRRKLTPAEAGQLRAWLDSHPAAQTDWEAEARLTEALGRLPDAPLSSNFTARVLQAVEADSALTLSRSAFHVPRFVFRWLPKAALCVLVAGAGLAGYHHHLVARRLALIKCVEVVSGVSSLPRPHILQDFDPIR